MTSYSDTVTAFDGIEKLDMMLKKEFGVVATNEKTNWFNETYGKSLKIIESDSINVAETPDEPIWESTSMLDASLAEYGVNINVSDSFRSSENFTRLQEAYYSGSNKYYRHNGTYAPGAYLDSTKTLILFVALKLDFMETSTSHLTRGDETSSGGLARNKSLAFTKYQNDSSLNSVLSNSFQTNYKKQIEVLQGHGGTTVDGLNPYNYYLEYGDEDYDLSFSKGNWFFDFKSGIITFSDDPGSNYLIDNDQPTQKYLYFTFVKYVGPTGLKKMLSVDPDFTNNSNNGSYYEDQVVIDSSNTSINLYKDGAWKSLGGNTEGIGKGFMPIGGIIMWLGGSSYLNNYGTWLECDGSEYNDSTYPKLAEVLGSSNGKFNVPNYQSKFPRATTTTSSVGSNSGADNVTLSANNLPKHTHPLGNHNHTQFSVGNHTHTQSTIANHTHNVTGSEHNHAVSAHQHNTTSGTTSHSHTVNTKHAHSYLKYTLGVGSTTGKGNRGSNVLDVNSSMSHKTDAATNNVAHLSSGSYTFDHSSSVGDVNDTNTNNAGTGKTTGSNVINVSGSTSNTITSDTVDIQASDASCVTITVGQSTAESDVSNNTLSASFSILPSYFPCFYYIRAE